MTPAFCAALFVLGRVSSEELSNYAVDWIAEGLDSPSLRRLAGTESPIMSETGPLFLQTLRELGIEIPTRDQSLMILAKDYAQKILDGSLTPHEGAGFLWWNVINEMTYSSPLFLSFVGAASELDELDDRTATDGFDRSDYRKQLEQQILDSARELLRA